MIDLKTKQAFWAEQLPVFKEKYWIPEHLEVLEFDMLGGCFEIAENVKTDLSEDDLFDIYHRVNSGWAMWKKAVSFMKATVQAVPEGYVLFPIIATKEIDEILGMQCFQFIRTSQIYRKLGFEIKKRAENEQAFFLFKFLHLALVHGDKYLDVFNAETRKLIEASESGAEG